MTTVSVVLGLFFRATLSAPNLEELLMLCSRKSAMILRPSVRPGVPWRMVW